MHLSWSIMGTSLIFISSTSGQPQSSNPISPTGIPNVTSESVCIECESDIPPIGGWDGRWWCRNHPCMVPVEVRQAPNKCSSGYHNEYLLRIPRDGMQACMPAKDMTYDFWGYNSKCAIHGTAPLYNLITPVDEVWACAVPSGWSYSQKMIDPGTCGPNNETPLYRLVQPLHCITESCKPSGQCIGGFYCPYDSTCGEICCSKTTPHCVNSDKGLCQ